jgi:hypothetical protein
MEAAMTDINAMIGESARALLRAKGLTASEVDRSERLGAADWAAAKRDARSALVPAIRRLAKEIDGYENGYSCVNTLRIIADQIEKGE